MYKYSVVFTWIQTRAVFILCIYASIYRVSGISSGTSQLEKEKKNSFNALEKLYLVVGILGKIQLCKAYRYS
jgi:hypothetical protein